mmetsp:Transcript_21341/g.32890  ORF Transcript_21341/g.32890 Transcript_21341/m.32890 type:complete len:100 (-) Transcript_21341:10-309(-)|eukprot:CAMPEP_0195291360 /NCGR_PEP_ID=MMETSP0707-20130614/7754_1 /TAXON_ID=33640 /ORGANISM="Asterionellopsis glacialis, Strain CCMP134" /LENGTH=99 /DNA_ID=CAMNT_0040351667 /DNA_START=97 /DNA_END=396 /DNA_ORIENTATION=+
MTAAEEAAQLDSVTDVVQETELDASKVQQAMSALAVTKENKDEEAAAASVAVSKEDVALIVSELEVTEEVATRALREVADENTEGNAMVVAALRRLVST